MGFETLNTVIYRYRIGMFSTNSLWDLKLMQVFLNADILLFSTNSLWDLKLMVHFVTGVPGSGFSTNSLWDLKHNTGSNNNTGSNKFSTNSLWDLKLSCIFPHFGIRVV